MQFRNEVEGPLFLGAMMVAFVEVYDEAGRLFNPPDGQVRVQTGAGDFLAFLHPGDKGTGKCEFAPLMGQDAQYMFRMESVGGAVWSDWAVCDLSLPYVDERAEHRPTGQLHKSFYVRFHEGPPDEPPDPPPDPDPNPRIAELEAALRDQRRRWSVLRQAVARQAAAAMAAIDLALVPDETS